MKRLIHVGAVIGLLSSALSAQEDSLLTHAKIIFADGEYKLAARELEEIVGRDPMNVAALKYLGFSLQNLGRYREAVSILERAAGAARRDIAVLLALAHNYGSAGLLEKAEAAFIKAYQLDTSHIRAVLSLANFYFDQKNWGAAGNLYRRSQNDDPENMFSLVRLGLCEWNTGHLEEAAGILHQAHNKETENAHIANQLSSLYVQMEMPESALKIIDTGLLYHEKDIRFHRRKADIFFTKREFKQAASSYLRAMELGDSTAGTLRSLGVAEFFLEQYELALRHLEGSFEKDDTEALTMYYEGLALQKMGKANASIAFFKKAIDLAPSRFIGDALTQMSVSYELDDDLRGAVLSLKRAISLLPENKTLFFYLASLYDRHYTDHTVARRYYEEFIKTAADSDEKLVQQAVRRLQALREEEHFKGKK